MNHQQQNLLMEQKSGNRIEYIDTLRGFTMILVIYHHIAFWCMDNIELGYNEFFIKFRMPLFFFISGWLFYKVNRLWNKETICSILKKKFRVQIIPFLFFMLLYMYLFNGPEYETSFEFKYGFWFTFALFQYFVIYIGIEALFNKQHSNNKEIGVMLFMLALSIIAFYYEQMRFDLNIGIWRKVLTLFSFSKIKYIFFFWLGTYVKKNSASFIRFSENQYVIAGCLGIFFLFAIYSKQIYLSNNELRLLSYLLSGVTGIIIVFTFFRKHEAHFTRNNRFGKVLQFIGQHTLDIYLLHYFVLPYHMNFLGAWLSEHNYKSVDMLIMLILSVWIIAISLLISYVIRLSPFLGYYLLGAKTTSKNNNNA